MKELDMFDDSSLSLSKADLEFAEKVLSFYRIPLDILYLIILGFKHTISNPFDLTDEMKNKKKSKIVRQKALVLHDNIIEVIIRSESGIIRIDHTDDLFGYFMAIIRTLRNQYKKYLPVDKNKEWLIDGDIFYLYNMLEKRAHLKPSQSRITIGLFLAHYKVFKRKPLRTLEEWGADRTNDKTYRQYLDHRVKIILIPILKRFKMQDADFQ